MPLEKMGTFFSSHSPPWVKSPICPRPMQLFLLHGLVRSVPRLWTGAEGPWPSQGALKKWGGVPNWTSPIKQAAWRFSHLKATRKPRLLDEVTSFGQGETAQAILGLYQGK